MSQAQGIVCPACQKRYSWKPELAGKKVRCACGQVMLMEAAPAPAPAPEDDLLDFAPEPAAPAPSPAAAPARPASTRDSVNDAIRQRLGVIPGKTSQTREKERQMADRAAAEAKTQFNVARDVIVPIMLIVVGIVLLMAEATTFSKSPVSVEKAIPIVIFRVVLSLGVVSGGMFLARAALDVNLVHGVKSSLLRICGIALGPAAVYGILSASMGDVTGPAVGALASIALYAILFAWLLQLDAKDTAVCVTITWILIAGVNYLAFRLQGLKSDSWI